MYAQLSPKPVFPKRTSQSAVWITSDHPGVISAPIKLSFIKQMFWVHVLQNEPLFFD
jgi:hypothetical protein